MRPTCDHVAFAWVQRLDTAGGKHARPVCHLWLVLESSDAFTAAVYSSDDGFQRAVATDTLPPYEPNLAPREYAEASLPSLVWVSPDERTYVLLLAGTGRELCLVRNFGGVCALWEHQGGGPLWCRQPMWGRVVMWPYAFLECSGMTAASPSGDLLAMACDGQAHTHYPDTVALLNIRSGKLAVLYAGGPQSLYPAAPVWSPDGTRIAAQLWGEEVIFVTDLAARRTCFIRPSAKGIWNVQWASNSGLAFQDEGSNLFLAPVQLRAGNHTNVFDKLEPVFTRVPKGAKVSWCGRGGYFAFREKTTVWIAKLADKGAR